MVLPWWSKTVRSDGVDTSTVRVDGFISRLHYRFTSAVFLVFAAIELAWVIFSNPVSCTFDGLPLSFANNLCFLRGTYTVKQPDSTNDVAHPGVSPYDDREESREYHSYYHWMPFMLALHGVLFYVPHWLWMVSEDGRMAAMIQDVRLPVLDRAALHARVRNLALYIRQTFGSYGGYFGLWTACSALNVINVIATFFMLDSFLNGKFLPYGRDVLRYLRSDDDDDDDVVDPFDATFPKTGKCTLHRFGSSGVIQLHDGLCALTLNYLHEKVLLALWAWLVVLAVFTCVAFLVRLLTLAVTQLRALVLERAALFSLSRQMRSGVHSVSIGDAFMLNLLAQNVSPLTFQMLLRELARAGFRRLSAEEDPDADAALGQPDSAPSAPMQNQDIPMTVTSGGLQKRPGYSYGELSDELH